MAEAERRRPVASFRARPQPVRPVPSVGVLSLRTSTVLPAVRPVEASPSRHPAAVSVTKTGCGGAVTGGNVAEREGTAAAGPECPVGRNAVSEPRWGEFSVSSAGPDTLRSSAQRVDARHCPAAAHTETKT